MIRNTHNQPVYVNPEHIPYVTSFKEDVSIVALLVDEAGEQPHAIHIRGSAKIIPSKLFTQKTKNKIKNDATGDPLFLRTMHSVIE